MGRNGSAVGVILFCGRPPGAVGAPPTPREVPNHGEAASRRRPSSWPIGAPAGSGSPRTRTPTRSPRRRSASAAGALRHSGTVDSVTFSPDGKLLASAGGDGTVRRDAAPARRCGPSTSTITPRLSPRRRMAGGRRPRRDDHAARGIRRQEHARVGKHDGPVIALAFTADGKGSPPPAGLRVAVWDVAGAKRIHLLELQTTPCCSCCPSPRTASSSRWPTWTTGRLWDAAKGEEALRYLSRRRHRLLAGRQAARRGRPRVPCACWTPPPARKSPNSPAGRSVTSPRSPSRPTASCWRRVATTGCASSTWRSGRSCTEPPAAPHGVPRVAFSPTARRAYAAATPCAAGRGAWKERFAPDGPITEIDALAYSPDGKTLAAAGPTTTASCSGTWRRASSGPITCEGQGVHCLAFAPDGQCARRA